MKMGESLKRCGSAKAGDSMLRMFVTDSGDLTEITTPCKGCWINLADPTDAEITHVAQLYDIDLADMRAPLDEEERSRVEIERNYTMVIVDIPSIEQRAGGDWYDTIPLSIIVTDDVVITVCSMETFLLEPFMEGSIRNLNTAMHSRFILQVLYRNTQLYLRYLRRIDHESDVLEAHLVHSTQNKEILKLMELSKTLVYFATSLRSNEGVLERLMNLPRIQHYQDDQDLLDDVIIENKQAIEMTGIYSQVLSTMTDAFGTVVSNNLNNVMRIFTVISIVISVPTLVFSAYGMNVQGVPLASHPAGFLLVCIISLAITVGVAWWLMESRMFRG